MGLTRLSVTLAALCALASPVSCQPSGALKCSAKDFDWRGVFDAPPSVIVKSLEECAQHCKDLGDCVAASYLAANSRCYPKFFQSTGLVAPSPQPGTTVVIPTGSRMPCDLDSLPPCRIRPRTAPEDNIRCVAPDADYPGVSDMIGKSGPAETRADCATLCQKLQGCQGAAWVSTSKRCYPKRLGYRPPKMTYSKGVDLIFTADNNLSCDVLPDCLPQPPAAAP